MSLWDCCESLFSSSHHVSERVPTSDHSPASQSMARNDLSRWNNYSKMGWIYYISMSFGALKQHEKMFLILSDGSLYLFEHEKSPSDSGNNEGIAVLMDLTGASVRHTTTSLGKCYGIMVSSQSMTVELDADSLTMQEEWITAIKAEIEGANINMIICGQHESNPGVVDWYNQVLLKRKDATTKLCSGTPMKKHYINMGRHKEHERIVQLGSSGKRVQWRAVGESAADKDIAIVDITDIWEGARSTVFESIANNAQRSPCCWSIIGEDRTVDFEAQTISEKEKWVDNLQRVRQATRIDMLIAKNKRVQVQKNVTVSSK